MVIPLKYISMRVTNTDIGMLRPMMNVLLNERRNTKRTAIARSAPVITDFTTSQIVCSMMSVVFEVSTIFISSGSSSLSFSRALRTFLAAVTEFFPLCF